MSSTTKTPLKLILGAGNVGDTSIDMMARYDTPDQVQAFLDAFLERGHNQIDTARGYSPSAPKTSEPRLGAVKAGERAIIDTKVISFPAGSHAKAKVLAEIDASLKDLGIEQINVEFLHAPDRETPFEEPCEAMDQAYREGKIRQWGLSNYTAEEVQQFVDICEAHGWVKPSVYQGQYNPIVRSGESALFPVLRRNNMAFYAYSPAAGGFFAGNHKANTNTSGGRFDIRHFIGGLYSNMYVKPAIIAATEKVVEVAGSRGISGHAAALRWTMNHGILRAEHGDAVIVGASSVEQLRNNLDVTEQGPLPDDVVAAFDALNAEIGSEVAYHF